MAKLDEAEVRTRLQRIFEPFERKRGLHGKVRWRMQHFFLDPAVDPQMPGSDWNGADQQWEGQWQGAAKQSTRLQAEYAKWIARYAENTWKVDCRPMRDTIPGKAKANKAEALLVQGFEFIRERTGIDLQTNMGFGKAIKGAAVLYWRIDTSVYEEGMPDYDERDDLAEYDDDDDDDDDIREGKRKERERYEYDEETKRYREKPDSLKDRIARYKAECGFPVYVETIPIEQCAWQMDMSTKSQLAAFAVKRVIPSLEDWKADKLKKRGDKLPRLGMSQESEGSLLHWMPSDDGNDQRDVALYEYWDRDYWYEWADVPGESGYFDCGEHWYKQPPFAIDYGRYNDVADPVWAYLPVFNAMLEEKPFADRDFSILRAAVEQSSIETYLLNPTGKGVPALTEDGDTNIDMSPGSTEAGRVPAGYELKAYGGNGVNAQLFRVNEMVNNDLEAARPSTGFAQFSATTQPTSAWQEQAQENMEPKQHIRNTARALQVMVNNLIQCFADKEHGPGEVFGYAKTDKGSLDRSKVLALKPQDWEDIIADVRITEVGNVERAALEELGMMKLEKGILTDLEYIGDYEGKPNPEEVFVQRTAWNSYKSGRMPQRIREIEAKTFGAEVALAPGLVPMVNGQVVSDEDAIAARGGVPMAGGQVPGSGGLQAAAPTTQVQGAMPRAQLGVSSQAGAV